MKFHGETLGIYERARIAFDYGVAARAESGLAGDIEGTEAIAADMLPRLGAIDGAVRRHLLEFVEVDASRR